MVVRKILEATLIAGSTSVTFTDTDIPNSLLRVYSTKSALFPISQTLSGNSVTVNYKPQDSNVGVALEIVKSGLDIVDDLLTDDSTKALSANQGYVLKGLIDGIVIPTVPENITDLDDVDVSDIANGQVLAWNSTTEKFENVNQSGGSSVDYSDNEHVVGTWTDGSTLYEKTIYIAAPISGSYYSHSINNASNIIFIHDVFARRNNAWNAGIYYLGSGDNLTILVNESSTQGIYIQFNSQITNVYITLRYTKTS